MQDKTKASPANLFGAVYANNEWRSMTKQQAERFMRAHAKLMDNFEQMTSAWLSSQRRTAQATIDAVGKLCECNDVSQATSVYNEWLSDNVERMVADSKAMGEKSAQLLQDMFEAAEKATVEAMKTAKDEGDKAVEKVRRAAS